MRALYNLILDSEGYKPVTDEDLKPVCGASWHNWVKTEEWMAPDGRMVSMDFAIEEVRSKQGVTV